MNTKYRHLQKGHKINGQGDLRCVYRESDMLSAISKLYFIKRLTVM